MARKVDKNEPNPFEGWMGLADASDTLGRDITLVRKWIRQGKVRAFTFGQRIIVVNIDELREYDKVYFGLSKSARAGN